MYKQNRKNRSKNFEAIALSYEEHQDHAPRIIGKGKGEVGENILKIAAEHNIPIQRDEALVEVLSQLDIHTSIPEELYEVVAEIFAFLYQMEKEAEKIKK